MKKNITLFLFFLAFASQVLGNETKENKEADDTFTVQSTFTAQEGDAVFFIKSQLIFLSFKQVVSNALKKIGHEPDFFWEHFENDFNEHFLPVQENLEKKYIENLKNPTEYRKVLRKNKYKSRKKFYNLPRFIKSYTVTNFSRSQERPQLKFLTLKASVNYDFLNKIYFELRNKDKNISGGILFFILSSDFDREYLKTANVNKKEMVGTLIEYWKKWFSVNLSTTFSEIIFKVKNRSDDILIKNFVSEHYSKSEHKSGKKVYIATLNLKVMVSENRDILKTIRLNLGGSIDLIDYDLNLPLYDKEFSLVSYNYDLQNKEGLNDFLSYIYNWPLSEYKSVEFVVKRYPKMMKKLRLTIAGLKNYKDILYLQNYLHKKGRNLQLKSKIAVYGTKEAILDLYINGDEIILRNLLMGLRNIKTINDRIIKFPDQENLYYMVLNSVE